MLKIEGKWQQVLNYTKSKHNYAFYVSQYFENQYLYKEYLFIEKKKKRP